MNPQQQIEYLNNIINEKVEYTLVFLEKIKILESELLELKRQRSILQQSVDLDVKKEPIFVFHNVGTLLTSNLAKI